MDFMTCKQTAEKWGVGIRIVQRWCQQGRIPGVLRKGNTYYIPIDSTAPIDRRVRQSKEKIPLRISLILDTDFPTTDPYELRCREYTELYLGGHLDEAEQGFSTLLGEVPDDSYRLPVLLLLAMVENVNKKGLDSDLHLEEVKKIVSGGNHKVYQLYSDIYYGRQVEISDLDIPGYLMPMFLLYSTRSMMMRHFPQLKSINMNHLELLCKYEDANGSELIQVYFHCLLAIIGLLSGNYKNQLYHEEKARNIILRRKWYQLFAEYYYFLDWHLGNYIKDPEELQYVQTLTQTVFENYVGNACAKNLTTNPQLLVPDLLKVAVLRSLNMSNGDIAEHMDISPYYVRKYSEELAFCTDNANKEELREIVRKMKLIM